MNGLPSSRALRFEVTGRAKLIGKEDSFETEDIRISEVVSVILDSNAFSQWNNLRTLALRSASRRVGTELAHSIMGIPYVFVVYLEENAILRARKSLINQAALWCVF